MVMTEGQQDQVSRLGTCQICERIEGKYRCPRCDLVTCSLTCVTTHKEKDSCDGVRNKSKFIPMGNFTELDVLSDYRLLESATRCVDSYARDRLKRVSRINREGHIELPRHLVVFRNACYRRGKCKIRFLPPHFQRHKSNCSKYDWKKNLIMWKIVLNFVHSSTKVELKVPETALIYDILRPYIDDSQKYVQDDDDVIEQSAYLVYQAAGFARINVKLKAEGLNEKARRFYDLELDKTLRQNLEGKSLIEHPVISISLQSHCDYFDNMSDDEDDLMNVADEEEESKPEINQFDQPTTSEVKQEHDVVPSDQPKTREESEVYKNCFDYYLNYYNEKYGVQQQPPRSNGPGSTPGFKGPSNRGEVMQIGSVSKPGVTQGITAAVAEGTSPNSQMSNSGGVTSSGETAKLLADVKAPNLLGGLVTYSDSDSE